MNHVRIYSISRISPVTDAEAERLVCPATLTDLAAQITATAATPAHEPRHTTRRHWPAGLPLAAAAALAVIVLAAAIVAITRPSAAPAPRTSAATPRTSAAAPRTSAGARRSTVQAQVLSFTASGGYITVIVRNPLADPSRYRAQFAAHHLDITLHLVPVSPSIVGTVVYLSEPAKSPQIQTITAPGRCYTGGGGSACPVGVRIPAGFRGQAEVVFGRAARPGEQYESTAPVTAPGEAMHGLTFVGDTVAQVLAMLRERHVTVPDFNYSQNNQGHNVAHVPGSWYVYGADPWAPGQVMLEVGPTRTQPTSQAPQPGAPVATPSA